MPPAVLAWLDYSEADQRRAREIVRMFSQPESRDELGLGQIRDALSDTLFPGTSVLLTRARYLLFVPWFYREGARLRRQGSQLSSWVDTQERRLIGALRNGGDSSGLIGGVVGEQVQNLPSTIYWNSLRRFGILRHDGTPTQIAGPIASNRTLPKGALHVTAVGRSGWVPKRLSHLLMRERLPKPQSTEDMTVSAY